MNPTRRSLCLTLVLAALVPTPTRSQEPTTGPQPAVRLVYELPMDALQRSLQDRPDLDLEQLLARTVRSLQARLTGVATVTRSEASGFTVDFPVAGPVQLAGMRALIESPGTLEMRIVADADYDSGGVRFDLQAERERLRKWLDDGGRERVLADPRAIDAYRAADAEHLRWVPHVVRPRADDAERWQFAYVNVTELQQAIVRLFGDDDWNAGQVPAALLQQADPHLIELVPLNLHEIGFTERDLDPAGTRVTKDHNNAAAIHYAIVRARQGDYSDWSEKHVGKCSAIVVNGKLVSAPRFMSRIPGRGIISGHFGKTEAEVLVRSLQGGALPVAPKLLRQETLPAKK